ncbi:fimbria/pilus outer membrane usher protein [Providencia rettgeri]|nr:MULTISPECIES: fimbria/pilus outer membrane usher protein [Providencia]EJD6370839.1 fimbria/pilus outer membrane usher protein [Providencia rettgeri]ELR5030406.1 fimbria/pilus outer membrane usher protein [Providencia rettgeri]ELR5131215.1 fimbria/pilus outer membrane usher protein [Providencia rettgeri]ELR5161140.1 fimbria/pilus outer membrane usher protein [Providencia rettgeri]ELR5210583.1 fimbria/pilus outer membrane usher protein [Providencia rettgeri]
MKSIRLNLITKLMLLILTPMFVFSEEAIDFNTDFLETDSTENVDFSKFSHANYIPPGNYSLAVSVNRVKISMEQPIIFFTPDYDDKISLACITPELYKQLGLQSNWSKKITWLHNDQCLDIRSIPDMSIQGDLAKNNVDINIPQAFMEYQDPNWDPPSRWDDGILGAFIDYNATGRIVNKRTGDKGTESGITATGTMGTNIGAWRVRADWQTQKGELNKGGQSWSWNQLYLYRAIRALNSRLTFGEQYLSSELFDSIRYVGASLETNESMLPPRLQGYAPEIAGVAKSNATVIVKQDGRIIYQTEVSPGPFRIQDVNSFGGGTLDVSVQEQDGNVTNYKVETSRLGTLTRPGQLIYKLVLGKPSKNEHSTQGPVFSLGSLSWGATNNTTVYGGVLGSSEYQNIALGIGRDFAPFGVLSGNISVSRAEMGRADNHRTLTGNSYNLTYSKQFDDINSQITFAGYRFSERNYMNMSQFIDRRYNDSTMDSGKELYTIIFGTAFPEYNTNMYLNYSHQTYWNRSSTDQYNLTVSNYFDIGKIKNLSLSLTAYKTKSHQNDDNGVYLNLNVPLNDNQASISYSGSFSSNSSHNVNYYDRINERSTYSISAGTWDKNKVTTSGMYNYDGDAAQVNINGTYTQDNQTALSMQLKGGLTVTPEGGALHRNTSINGGSRVLIDTNGIEGIPVRTGVTPIKTNRYGKAVITSIMDFNRNNLRIDINSIPDNAEALDSNQYATLTEGAIGYRKFNVIKGEKILGTISLENNSYPPFGSSVINEKNIEVGIVSDNGFVYLAGINQSDILKVKWGDKSSCHIQIPEKIEIGMEKIILLPCK